jgi:putative oxidoreductase
MHHLPMPPLAARNVHWLPGENCGYTRIREYIEMNEFLQEWSPRAQGLLRIVTAYLFLTHGMAKLFGVPHVAMFDNVSLFSLVGFAGILELAGGAMLLIGLLTRPVAFLLSGEMAVAYFMEHATKGNPLVPMLNEGELAVVYCFVFLFFAAAGAGAWSVDAARTGERRRPALERDGNQSLAR